MATNKSDIPSVLWAAGALCKLQCPDIRPCEGDDALVSKLHTETYKRTPDLIAGPIRGAGAPWDFYIDVAELSGGALYNPSRPGGVPRPLQLADPINHKGEVKLDSSVHFDAYESTIERKFERYSVERENSPMFGLCIHLDVSVLQPGATVTVKDVILGLTRFDYLSFLDKFFCLPAKDAEVAFKNVLDRENERGVSIVYTQFPKRFAFLCHTVFIGQEDVRMLLFVNQPLLDERGDMHRHPVFEWLRHLGS